MTRARPLRFAALVSAAAVLLGLGVVAATPAAADASALSIESIVEYTDSSGVRHVFGEIVNNGTTPVAAQADLSLLDANGDIVGSEIGIPFLKVVAPNGGRAPFEAQPTDPYDRVQATPSVVDAAPPFNHAFTVTKKAEFTDAGTGARQIDGEVRNDNTVAATGISVVFTFYNAAGGVVSAEALGVSDLAPGASTPFIEPVNPDVPAYSTWRAVAEATSAPSGAGDEPPPSTGTNTDSTTTLTCNPAMRLSTKTVNVGRTTTVTVAGATPGSKVTLEGYSRPSTEYASIRTEVTVAADGTIAPIAVRPPTSARVRLQIAGCSTPGTGQVISVIPGLGVTVTRVGAYRYTFSGKIIPGKQNLGRAISLYLGVGTAAPVKKAVARSAADGSYRVTLTLPRGPIKAYWATGADMTNLAGRSAVKSFTSS